MGVLRHLRAGRAVSLGSRCLVGRSPSAALRLDHRLVSADHALFTWVKGEWLLRDIGSRNGTWLDGARLQPGLPAPLRAGSRVGFGSEQELWELADAGAPGLALQRDGGALRRPERGLLALPDDDHPELTLFRAGEAWQIEGDELDGPLAQGQALVAGGARWTALLPCSPVDGLIPSTWETGGGLEGDVALHIAVSRDEEHVDVEVEIAGVHAALSPRAHHFLTLLLARERERDRQAGLPLAEQGWIYVEDLCEMLKLDLSRLNVQIFRARQQLAEAGVERAAALFERRRLSRQLRLNVARVTIRSA